MIDLVAGITGALVLLKMFKVIDWPWMRIFTPLLILLAVIMALFVIANIFIAAGSAAG